MTHECACHTGTATTTAVGAIRAWMTVGQVARHSAVALAVLKQMGINHCCGGGLTLGEAAAAAGVPIEGLLAALNEGANVPA